MKIDLFYFDGCPSWQTALENLNTALALEGLDIAVNLIIINSDQEASEFKFLGSPSIQIDGKDMWPEQSSSFYMNCRVYKTPKGLRGWPTVDMFRLQLKTMPKDQLN